VILRGFTMAYFLQLRGNMSVEIPLDIHERMIYTCSIIAEGRTFHHSTKGDATMYLALLIHAVLIYGLAYAFHGRR